MQEEIAHLQTNGGESSQTVIRIQTPRIARTSSEWRGQLAPANPEAPWESIAIYQGGSALSFIARTPAASRWQADHAGDVVMPVLDLINEVVRVDISNRNIGMRETPYLWQYTFPKLVVSKDKTSWDALAQPLLGEAARAKLTHRITNDLTQQAIAWGLRTATDPIRVTIIDSGKPMPITNAVRSDANRSGKPVTVLARLNVRVVIDSRMEGEWLVGMLSNLGYGRMFRDGYAQAKDLSERNLSELGIELEKAHA